MWKRVLCLTVLAALSPFLGCIAEPAEEKPAKQKPMDKTEMEIRQLADKAFAAMTSKDLDGLMKLAGVPWQQDNQIFETREELAKYWAKRFGNPKDLLYKAKLTIWRIDAHDKARRSFPPGDPRDDFDKVMRGRGWLLYVNNPRVGTGFTALLLSPRDGKLKVVGSGL